MADPKSSRYANRLDAATYADDKQVHFGIARSQKDPESWIGVSDRLISRLTSLGMAYELGHVQRIDIYGDTIFKSQQCEKLYRELAFLGSFVRDPALGAALNTLGKLIKPALGKPMHLMVSGN